MSVKVNIEQLVVHKEKKCEPQTANTNTVLDEVMLQIPLNTELSQY